MKILDDKRAIGTCYKLVTGLYRIGFLFSPLQVVTSIMKEGKRYDWYPSLCHSFFDELVTSLYQEIEIKKGWKNKSNPRKQSLEPLIKHVLSSLYSCFYSFPIGSGYVSYPLRGEAYDKKSEHKVNYNLEYASALFHVLKDKKWVTVVAAKNQQSYTRIKASGGLRSIFEEQGFKWSPQEPLPIHKLVQVRDRVPNTDKSLKKKWKKIDMPLPNKPIVREYQEELFKYNSFMCQQCVSLYITNDQLSEVGKDIKRKQNDKKHHNNWMSETEEENKIGYLDISSVQLRRIFSRNSLTKHERFYGGWWQSLPSKYRRHIMINDKKTVEVDYSGMSIRILYGMANQEYKGNEDIYDLSDGTIAGHKWKFGRTSPQRKLIKKYINAFLNDEDGNYRLTDEEHKELGFDSIQIRKRFLKVHAAIADLANAKIGLETQFYDSEIAMEVMQFFIEDDTPVLPIHDSFIIRAGFNQYLRKAMQTAIQKRFGQVIPVTEDGPRLPEHFGMTDEEFDNEDWKDPKYFGLNAEDMFSEGHSMMEKYLDKWRGSH